MGKLNLKKELFNQLGLELAVFGFQEKPKLQEFSRSTKWGWQCVHLAFMEYDAVFDVTLDFGIRFDGIENLANSVNKLLTKKEKEGTCTIGVQLEFLSSDEAHRWTIEQMDDIAPAVAAMNLAYQKYGKSYFSKYCSMNEIYSLLVRDDKEAWMYSPIHTTRAIKCIAASILLEHEDIADQVNLKRGFLERHDDQGLAKFLEFCNSALPYT